MGTRENVQGSLNVPAVRRSEAACLALAAMAAMAHLGGLVLVIGGTVLTFWAISGTLLAASVGLRLMSHRAARSTAAPRHGAQVRLVRSIVTFVVLLIGLGAAIDDLSASYQVLSPPSADGCLAVVREHSFLFAGRGAVYAVNFSGIGSRMGSWTTDDGYEPVAQGSYTLRWDGDTGVLNLIGGIDPVWPTIHTIRCS